MDVEREVLDVLVMVLFKLVCYPESRVPPPAGAREWTVDTATLESREQSCSRDASKHTDRLIA